MNLRHVIIMLYLVLLSGCSSERPRPKDGEVMVPGEQLRPGTNESDEPSLSEDELIDAGLRYEGPSISLRYDDGGVLAVRESDVARAFHRLDGGTDVAMSFESVRPDGTISDMRLSVNSTTIPIASACVVKSTDAVMWILAVDADGARHLLVIER